MMLPPGHMTYSVRTGLLFFNILLLTKADSPPIFSQTPTDAIGMKGGVVSFVCQASGDPQPIISWSKKGKKLSSQRYKVIDFKDGSGSVLRIQPLETRRDEGVYECVATNSAGQISTSTNLTVLREDQLPQGFPSIDVGPRLKVVERSRIATMLCAASGNPDPEITWFKDFLPFNTSNKNSRIKLLQSESFGALQIDQSEETDQGKYECVATNSEGTRYSSPANLYVRVGRVPPRFSVLPEDSDIMNGGSINITCEAVGSPMPYVKWMLGSKDLTPKDDVPVGRNVLELTDVRKSAKYTCVAMSPLGVIETEVQITVKSPPKFSRTPTDAIGVEGGVASFVCQASGDPQPIISWSKKGKKLTSQRYKVIDFKDGSGSVLRIQPLETRRDEAVYECVATNSAGQISTSTNLTVLREDQLPQGFPSIDVGPRLKVVERTRIATMLCAASGNPDPEITWFKDFLPFNTSNNNSRIKLLQSGALQIDQSEETDQGRYECVATNSEGTRYSAPANLYVRVGRVPPRFSVLPENSDIMPGGSINITCEAVGSPMPYVKWMLGSKDLTPKDDVPIGRNVLELTDVRKSAKYTCVAMSPLGVIETEVQITVKWELLRMSSSTTLIGW